MHVTSDSVGVEAQSLRLGAVDERRLLQAVYRRVFGASEPVSVGRFTVLERLGSGGMGVVFKAYDNQLDRKIALKFIALDRLARREQGGASTRVVQEARALARLSHPNVVQVYEVGETPEGELFLAMEFVDGETLRSWCGRGGRRWREIVDVCLQAAEGLAAAHAAGLVHRDVKPDNVLVGADGRVRVLDFGLADEAPGHPADRSAGEDAELVRVAGTPAYMAPEQLRGVAVAPTADQFALSSVLFEALYGVRPFAGETIEARLAAIAGARLTVAHARGGVPPAVHRVILEGLAADPARRHASMQLWVTALRDAAGRGRRRRRRWWGASLLAGAVAGGLAVLRPVAPEALGTIESDDGLDVRAIERAELLVATDPQAALRALGELSPGAAAWRDRGFVVAEAAAMAGLADREIAVDRGLEFVMLVGRHALWHDPARRELVSLDVRTGDRRALLENVGAPTAPRGIHLSGIPELLADPGGRFALWIEGDDARLLDLEGGTVVPLASHGGAVHDVRFAQDGSAIAWRAGDRVEVFAVPTGEHLGAVAMRGPEDQLAALGAGGTRVAVASSTHGAVVVEVRSADTVELPDVRAHRLAFGDDDQLFVASEAAGIDRWDLRTQTMVPVDPGPTQHLDVQVVGDGAWIVSDADGRGVELRELARDRKLERPADGPPVHSADGRWIAWPRDGHVRVLELESLHELDIVGPTRVHAFAFEPDGRGIVTWDDERVLRRVPLTPATPALRGHRGDVERLQFAPDGATLYSTAADHTLWRWDVASGRGELLAEIGASAELAVSSDGAWLASCSAGGTVTILREQDGTAVVTTAPHHRGLVFDGQTVLTIDDGGLVRLDPETGARTELGVDAEGCRRLSRSPSGRRLAALCGAGTSSTTVRVWSMPDFSVVHEGAQGWYDANLLDDARIIGAAFGHPLTLLALDSGRTERLDGHAGLSYFAHAPELDMLVVADDARGVALSSVGNAATARVPGTFGDDAGPRPVAIRDDGSAFAYVVDGRDIVVRRRLVPRDPNALQAWVADHRVTRTSAR